MVSFNARNREEEEDDDEIKKKTDQEEKFAWQENLREDDPWKHVKDIKGDLHYRVLSIPRNATIKEIKSAYRQKAREHHPDKGGCSETFDKVQKAFETLSCPKKREQYDRLQHVTQYRYIPGVTQRAVGGEDLLLDDIARLGLETDASTQLVVLCEVCGRPSTRVCMCSLYYCDFLRTEATLERRVWFALAGDAERSFEGGFGKKRIGGEEKRRREEVRVGRSELQRSGVFERDSRVQRTRRGDLRREETRSNEGVRYAFGEILHVWAQTTRHVYVAIMLPTGYKDKELHMDFRGQVLVVQSEDSPPVVERHLAFQPSREFPVQTMQTEDKRFFVLSIPKSNMGEDIKQCFEGDPDYARCMQPPYTLHESNTEVIMEFELPFWIDEEDVRVDITKRTVRVRVTNEIDTYVISGGKRKGTKSCARTGKPSFLKSAWSLDNESINSKGEKCRLLMICLAKPLPDQEEKEYKKTRAKITDLHWQSGLTLQQPKSPVSDSLSKTKTISISSGCSYRWCLWKRARLLYPQNQNTRIAHRSYFENNKRRKFTPEKSENVAG